MVSLAVAAAAGVAGTLIGLTGIGGVLLVPALTEFAQVPVDRAVAASMFAFLLGGVLAAVQHLRHLDDAARRSALPLCLAASAGAVAGAATVQWLGPGPIRTFIALLSLGSGLQALRTPSLTASERQLAPGQLGGLGLLVGYGSAISGTGGPAMLVPLLLVLHVPVRLAIALGLAVQVPISISATVVHAVAGRIDFALAMTLAALVLAGTFAGSHASRQLSRHALTMAVAITLISVGIWYGFATLR
ncbi:MULTISPECIES: sulfite exporter TauE/SafE family protein [Ramlibacter]|uniref:Probable membrane transporter protein n=1 Tax=Ramlibacter pinisoli TaxID=2682844 RepID=A0A6N8IY05_9BURK|nr:MULTISPECIES: sulfite exporter TauE/SafE family protein [Ramlibacter]MBA2961775.1 sulfite exporter TauE/SafE family protein [Ramlibacter sp. CGMCC 1.13660]MVQ31717.1 TSUP family transporter [Ramlibacter pinisoli]